MARAGTRLPFAISAKTLMDGLNNLADNKETAAHDLPAGTKLHFTDTLYMNELSKKIYSTLQTLSSTYEVDEKHCFEMVKLFNALPSAVKFVDGARPLATPLNIRNYAAAKAQATTLSASIFQFLIKTLPQAQYKLINSHVRIEKNRSDDCGDLQYSFRVNLIDVNGENHEFTMDAHIFLAHLTQSNISALDSASRELKPAATEFESVSAAHIVLKNLDFKMHELLDTLRQNKLTM